MTIKEVEQQLELPRATIRFYEKENLINPKRHGNTYREYSDEDVAVLKKIVILRKLGLPISEIKDALEGKVSLQELLEKNISDLQEKLKELEGAMKLCKKMQTNKEEFDSMDEAFYWEEIRVEENAGNKFMEIVNDVIKYEKKVFLDYFNLADCNGNLNYGKFEAVLRILGTCILIGVIWHLMYGGEEGYFKEGFFYSFRVIIICSIFGLPLHFLGKKHPKLAKKIKTIGWGIAFVLVLFLILLLIFGQ